MFIGLPKEIKNEEHRVALTPTQVKYLVDAGHCVAVGYSAGRDAGYSDTDYAAAGAHVVANDVVWNHELIVKVKEPLPEEYIKRDQIIFSYLHLAANRELTETLMKRNATGIAFETILDEDGRTPVLDPMSVIAGDLAAYKAAEFLQHHNGGKGILMRDAHVVVLGCGTAGEAAAQIAAGMGAKVTIVELASRLQHAKGIAMWMNNNAHEAVESTPENIQRVIKDADAIIGCVHVPGAPTSRLITEDMVKYDIRPGSVLIDVAIDQGGCFETSRPTSHSDPTFVKHDVLHYCVPNMPGIVPMSASKQISDHIWPYLLKIIDDPMSIPTGVNVHRGKVVHPAVAKAHNL
jgi:alanine dehydrogenase